MKSNKPVIGIVGGIGSGKSLVAQELVGRGGYLIAADPLGHEGLKQADLKAQVLSRFGQDLLDDKGEIDRRRLGRRVFSDVQELRALEAILFPYIGRRVREEIAKARENPASRFVVLDAAVMLEAGWNDACDYLIFVDAPESVRLARLVEKRGWIEAEVREREKMQMPLDEKKRRADAVVVNDSTPEFVSEQIFQLLRKWNLLREDEVIQ